MPGPGLNPDNIVCLAFISGTTGLLKDVLHSGNTLPANGSGMEMEAEFYTRFPLSCILNKDIP